MLDFDKLEAALREKFGDKIGERKDFCGETTIRVEKSAIRAVCFFLRDDARFRFNYLCDVIGIDYLNLGISPRFDAIYHLYSIPNAARLRLKCGVDESDCRIDSVVPVWGGANFLERETYDFFGIEFSDHPNLTRILMPEDWEGWPLRKDFPLGGTKSYYYKRDTEPYVGEPDDLVPRIRKEITDI